MGTLSQFVTVFGVFAGAVFFIDHRMLSADTKHRLYVALEAMRRKDLSTYFRDAEARLRAALNKFFGSKVLARKHLMASALISVFIYAGLFWIAYCFDKPLLVGIWSSLSSPFWPTNLAIIVATLVLGIGIDYVLLAQSRFFISLLELRSKAIHVVLLVYANFCLTLTLLLLFLSLALVVNAWIASQDIDYITPVTINIQGNEDQSQDESSTSSSDGKAAESRMIAIAFWFPPSSRHEKAVERIKASARFRKYVSEERAVNSRSQSINPALGIKRTIDFLNRCNTDLVSAKLMRNNEWASPKRLQSQRVSFELPWTATSFLMEIDHPMRDFSLRQVLLGPLSQSASMIVGLVDPKTSVARLARASPLDSLINVSVSQEDICLTLIQDALSVNLQTRGWPPTYINPALLIAISGLWPCLLFVIHTVVVALLSLAAISLARVVDLYRFLDVSKHPLFAWLLLPMVIVSIVLALTI
jgi:hypothetical protein